MGVKENVEQRLAAQRVVKELGAREPHFWRCLAEAAASESGPLPAKPSLTRDVIEALRQAALPGLVVQVTFHAELDIAKCTATYRDEAVSHALGLQVLEQAEDPDAHVVEMLRRLARIVSRGATVG